MWIIRRCRWRWQGAPRTMDVDRAWFEPPDAENRTSGCLGGLTGAIPSARPDPGSI